MLTGSAATTEKKIPDFFQTFSNLKIHFFQTPPIAATANTQNHQQCSTDHHSFIFFNITSPYLSKKDTVFIFCFVMDLSSLSCLWGSLRETTKNSSEQKAIKFSQKWLGEAGRVKRRLQMTGSGEDSLFAKTVRLKSGSTAWLANDFFSTNELFWARLFLKFFWSGGQTAWACPTQFVRWIGTKVKRRNNTRTAFGQTRRSSFEALEREAHFRSSNFFLR